MIEHLHAGFGIGIHLCFCLQQVDFTADTFHYNTLANTLKKTNTHVISSIKQCMGERVTVISHSLPKALEKKAHEMLLIMLSSQRAVRTARAKKIHLSMK